MRSFALPIHCIRDEMFITEENNNPMIAVHRRCLCALLPNLVGSRCECVHKHLNTTSTYIESSSHAVRAQRFRLKGPCPSRAVLLLLPFAYTTFTVSMTSMTENLRALGIITPPLSKIIPLEKYNDIKVSLPVNIVSIEGRKMIKKHDSEASEKLKDLQRLQSEAKRKFQKAIKYQRRAIRMNLDNQKKGKPKKWNIKSFEVEFEVAQCELVLREAELENCELYKVWIEQVRVMNDPYLIRSELRAEEPKLVKPAHDLEESMKRVHYLTGELKRLSESKERVTLSSSQKFKLKYNL